MAKVITGPSGGVPPEAVDAVARELGRQCHGGPPDESDIQLAADVLAVAAPVLAEAWNLPQLQAEHEEWQRRGETARRIQDDFWREHEGRYPPSDGTPEVPGA